MDGREFKAADLVGSEGRAVNRRSAHESRQVKRRPLLTGRSLRSGVKEKEEEKSRIVTRIP